MINVSIMFMFTILRNLFLFVGLYAFLPICLLAFIKFLF